MQTIYLDISNKGITPVVYAKQGDVGRKFEAVLTDAGVAYNPSGNVGFSVWYTGDSGEGHYTLIGDKSAFHIEKNKVTVELIEQMLEVDGFGVLCLVMNDTSGNQIGVWNIPYCVEPIPGFESEEAKTHFTAFSQEVAKLIALFPAVSGTDNDKIMRVVNGVWSAVSDTDFAKKADLDTKTSVLLVSWEAGD